MKRIKNQRVLKQFIHFLKENNAYLEYRTNIAKTILPRYTKRNLQTVQAFTYPLQIKLNMFKRVNELQDTLMVDRTLLIGNAFTWCDTPQGQDFWFNLYRKWIGNEMK